MDELRVTFILDRADLPSVAVLTEALTRLDELARRRQPQLSPLYAAGVPFRVEPPGVETFPTTPIMYRQGFGDCAPLAATRAAELRAAGNHRAIAFPVEPEEHERVCWNERFCPREIHVIVSRDGTLETLEDPSSILGMRPLPAHVMRRLASRSRELGLLDRFATVGATACR